MHVVEPPFNKIVILNSAAYYRIKNSIADAFLEVKNSFTLMLQVYSFDFPAEPKNSSSKMVFLVF